MKTNDIYFACYLIEKGNAVIDYVKDGRKIVFEFDIKDETKARLEYINSNQHKIKMQIENLRTLWESK